MPPTNLTGTNSALVVRWLKFNFVGLLGIGVQFGCFAILLKLLHLYYLWATPISVEAAVLHNFVWHERFTWKERTRKAPGRRDIGMRLLRFHAGNGVVSILGNMGLMKLLVGVLHMNLYVATGVSITLCSLLNFAASEWFVFPK
jgi:putative flippase GtrA